MQQIKYKEVVLKEVHIWDLCIDKLVRYKDYERNKTQKGVRHALFPCNPRVKIFKELLKKVWFYCQQVYVIGRS